MERPENQGSPARLVGMRLALQQAGRRHLEEDGLRTPRPALVLSLSACLVVAGCAGTSATTQPTVAQPSTTPPTVAPSNPAATSLLDSHPAGLQDLQAASQHVPLRVEIPSLHVSAPVTATTTDVATGELVVPPDPATVVWWAGGARPGDPVGTVALAGHVDYNGVAGALFTLRSLPVGSAVTVTGANRQRHLYRVTARRQVRKASLDQLNVFTTGGPPQLVLLTCGGAFDKERRSYDNNVIVVARPV